MELGAGGGDGGANACTQQTNRRHAAIASRFNDRRGAAVAAFALSNPQTRLTCCSNAVRAALQRLLTRRMIKQTVHQAVIYLLLAFIAGNALWQVYIAVRWLTRRLWRS
jgi:hypothetical protein